VGIIRGNGGPFPLCKKNKKTIDNIQLNGYNIVKVKELTQNKRKEGQYAEPKAKEKRPLVDTTKSHSDIGNHRTDSRDSPTLI